MSFYVTGDDATKAMENEKKAMQDRFKYPDFFIKPGMQANITFLDDDRFSVYEHMIFNGKRPEVYTCMGDGCPLCEVGNKRYLATFFTIIDHSEIQTKRGLIKNEKKLYRAKMRVAAKLEVRRKNLKGLKYKVFQVMRTDEKESAVGEDINYIKEVSPQLIIQKCCPKGVDPKEFIKPFPYSEILKPKPIEELRRIAGINPAFGSGDNQTQNTNNFSDPFKNFGVDKEVTPGSNDYNDPFGETSNNNNIPDDVFGDSENEKEKEEENTDDLDSDIPF